MNTTDKKIIMYESEESAKQMTVTGWVSSTGRFWGNDEHMARWEGSTHHLCDCGQVTERMYTICNNCQAKKRAEAYDKMPFEEWDGETPLVIFDDDTYFFDISDLEMHCEDNDVKPEDLRLVICVAEGLSYISEENWVDDLPEDAELPQAVQDAVKALNKAIDEAGTVAWFTGRYRTKVSFEISDSN